MKFNLLYIIYILLFCCSTFAVSITAQTTIDFNAEQDNKLYIKLYGHIDYNQKIESGYRHAGNLDVHRIVTLFGYQFSRKTQFVSEIEFEHVKEVFVEQAFVKHRLTKSINLRAGLLLIPMGMVNEAHEPTFFYSVERPLLDKILVPSTWREIGVGISGLIKQHSLRYQLYLVNNPLGYDDGPTINAEKGFRSARQKGAESLVTGLPGLSGQLEYFGFSSSKIGLSLYHGKSNTSLYEGDGKTKLETIDSSRVTISMAGLHANFQVKQWNLRGQYIVTHYNNSPDYNDFTGSNVPQLSHGFYLLASRDLLQDENLTLSPFVRFAHLNPTLNTIDSDNIVSLRQNIWTLGLNYKPNPSVVFKMDYQFINRSSDNNYQQFNTGVGVWF